jgi:acetyl esterase/lipase
MLRRTFLGAASCSLLCGQSSLSRSPDHANISYGPYTRNVLDLWQAKSPLPTPLVVYFHGGEFVAGDKSSLDPVLLDRLLAAGISVAAINIRYSKQFAPYPFPMRDAVRGLQFLRNQARQWNLDSKRVGATGIGSGGTLALWIGFHDDLADLPKANPVLRESSRLSAVAAQDAQTTYDPRVVTGLVGEQATRHPALAAFFGMTNYNERNGAALPLFTDASPVSELSKDDPPVLLIYTEPDKPLPAGAEPGAGIHHPRFGFYLRDRMERLGLECSVAIMDKPGIKPTSTEMTVAFFERRF